ncbi:MAG TPA: alpha/beta hydrolase [Myxococcaceae bacterium]|nr:alpha/beta hydrolase [Myxococcaceae bacterium]
MVSPTSLKTSVVPATSGPVAQPAAPQKPSLVNKVSSAASHAADAFAGALNKDLGVLGSAARKDLLHFPWPGKGSEGRPGWITRQDPTPTTDVTDQFRTLNAQASHGEQVLPSDAGKYKYLVIGGLFGKHLPGYMDENVSALKSQGLDARKVNVDSDASVEKNAETIRKAIEAASKDGSQVVLIGHSKGGVDAAAALSMHPELKDKVRALVAIQSPFGGSPIAQDIETTPIIKPLVNGVVSELFRGDPKSVKDLTYDSREKFLAKYPLPTDVPSVSVATSRLSPTSILGSSEEYMKARYGFPSDGLVDPEDAIIPGSHVVRINDMDHAESTVHGVPGFSHYYPKNVTLASVALALDAAREHDAAMAPSAGW